MEIRIIRALTVTSRFRLHVRVPVQDVLQVTQRPTVLRSDLMQDTPEGLTSQFRSALTANLQLLRFIHVRESSSYMTDLLTSGPEKTTGTAIE